MILNPSKDYNPQLLQVFQMWGIYKYILGADIKILTKYIFGRPAAIYGLTLFHDNA